MDTIAKSLKEDYLTCVICYELFIEPKSLPCLHTFCEGCLEILLDKSSKKTELSCPTCRETFPLPSKSVSSLKTNFIFKDIIIRLAPSRKPSSTRLCSFCILHSKEVDATHKCVTCFDLLCSFCVRHRHLFTRQTAYHNVVSLSDYLAGKYKKEKDHEILCERHQEKIRFFCPQCLVPICSECALMEHRYHEYVPFAQARNIIKQEVEKMLKISKAQQEKLIETQQSLCSKSEEVSSNETSLLAIVDSKFKEIQSKLNKHRQRIEKQIQRQCSAEKEKVNAILKENVNFQDGLKESVSFCNNILSNSTDLEVVYFFDDMKSSLLKCSNPDEKEYQGSLQRLEISVKCEINKLLNVIETFVDDKAKVKVGVRSGTLSVVDKETNTVSEDETCIEKGNVKKRKSKTLAEKKDTKTASMIIIASQDRASIEGQSKETQERISVNDSKSKSQSTLHTDKAECLTSIVPKCLKTYDLSDVSNEDDKCYTSVTWIDKTSFAVADEQNQTAIIISNVHGNTIVRSHSVKGIVAIASFNDYLACKTQSGDIFIYSYPEWNLERTFKGAYALSSRSSELIWVTKEKIIIFANNSIEERNIKDEDGKSFVFRRPFQFCCLPNNYCAITDKILDYLYMVDQSGHISTRIKLPGHIRALSCDKDNRIYMTCYETNMICILNTNGTCLSTISLQCILNKPRTISVRSEEEILVTNKYEVVLLSLK